MKNIVTIYICLSLSFLNFGCTEDKVHIPEVSGIDMTDFEFIRYDREVSNLDTNNVKESYLKLKEKHPNISDLYFGKLLKFESNNSDTFYDRISGFLKAKEITSIQDTIEHYFKDTRDLESELKNACQFLKYYFPDIIIPRFYTFQTEFGYQNIIFSDGDKDGIGIGLDMFLGHNFDYKLIDPVNPSFSNYLTRAYNRDHITKKAMEIIVLDLIGDSPGKRFIDQAIHNGKKLFILDNIMPNESDTIITEYRQDQLNWVENNELEIWSFFLEEQLIYETNFLEINKYLGSSPNSPGMPELAPGRTGNYIGWQIVKAYMKRNPDKTINDLVAFKDSQKLMELSKYKPKRR